MMSSTTAVAAVHCVTARTVPSRRWGAVVLSVGVALAALIPATGLSAAVASTSAGNVSATWAAHPDCIVCVM